MPRNVPDVIQHVPRGDDVERVVGKGKRLGIGLKEFDPGSGGFGFGDHARRCIDADKPPPMARSAQALGKIAGTGSNVEKGLVRLQRDGSIDRRFQGGSHCVTLVCFNAHAKIFVGLVLSSEVVVDH